MARPTIGAAIAASLAVAALAMPTPRMVLPVAPAMQQAAPSAPARATVKRQRLTAKQRQDRNARRRRAREEQERQAAARRRKGSRQRSTFQALVHRMWNAERQAWARAGYPGLHSESIEALEPYIARLRRQDAQRARAA